MLTDRAASPLAVRCVATALARSSALDMILARRKNTAISFDFRIAIAAEMFMSNAG
jgi:hypothetical protein